LDLPVLPNPDDKERYNRLVNALLSACLLNIDSMRCASIPFVLLTAHIFKSGRHGSISTKKMKNNMLAILTVTPPWVKIGKAVIEHAYHLISQKRLDADEV